MSPAPAEMCIRDRLSGRVTVTNHYASAAERTQVLDWLDHQTDFFSAPASTRFHGADVYKRQAVDSTSSSGLRRFATNRL